MHRAYIGIGSNMHDPATQVRTALAELAKMERTRVKAESSLYRSAPVGYAEQPDFVNAVAALETGLDAFGLLDRMLAMEHAKGRVRQQPNGPRILDLDLLLFDDERFESARLSLPHPRMHERAFVLIPLLEVAPDVAIPGRGPAVRLLQAIGPRGVERLTQ